MLASRNFLLGWRSPAAPIVNSFERSELGQVQDVDALVSCWIAVVWTTFHWFPKVRLPSLWRHFVGCPRSTCDLVPTFHGFVRAAVLLHALTTVCVFTPPIRTTFDVGLQCFSDMMPRNMVFPRCLTEVPCQTSCPDFVMENRLSESFPASLFLSTCLFFC